LIYFDTQNKIQSQAKSAGPMIGRTRAPIAALRLPCERVFSTRDFLAKVDPTLQENNAEVPRVALDDSFAEESTTKTMAGGFSETGFYVNDVELEGSVMLLPRSSFLWAPKSFAEVTPESLKLIGLLEPTFEFLILGSGERTRRPNQAIIDHFKGLGVVVEQMNSVSVVYF
jgi:uncharacterized protein